MKKIFNILLVMLAALSVACDPESKKVERVDNGPLTFEIDIRGISWNSAMVEIFPSNDVDTYYFSTMEKTAFDQYESDEVFINEIVAELQARCETEGYPLSEILSQYSDGWHYDKELASTTEYCVYVFGLTSEGVVTTGLTTATFKTIALGDGRNESPVGIDQGNTVVEGLTWGSYLALGDYYGNGVAVWIFSLNKDEGLFEIQVHTDLSVTGVALGEFPIKSSFDTGVAMAGGLNHLGYSDGTYWICCNSAEDDTVKEKVYCQSGTVSIAKEGDIFTIEVDAIDEYGNSITASYTGELYNNTPTYN